MNKASIFINEISAIPDNNFEDEIKQLLIKAAEVIVNGIESRRQTGPYKDMEKESLYDTYYVKLVNMINKG